MKKTSIIDIAKDANSKDSFGIEPFEKGLIRFINHSNTPITIALQGEWGSGKTSLMNSLQQKLCNDSDFHGIWLNTWEYALMKDAQTTLIGIISALVQETIALLKQDESQTKKLLGTFGKMLKNVGSNAVKSIANQAFDGTGDAIAESFSSSKDGSISTLRNELEEAIESCIKKDKKKGFIFFIDDLDRIDPPVAVQLLELLKNIFTLKNCVFVLAIDYDVVIKGLEPKFGKMTEKNEREFRSFFDKIIQLPFSMPVSNYNIDEFLKESLIAINYLEQDEASNKPLMTSISNIANLSVGTNPRALKRLLNSLSLISCINEERNLEVNDSKDSDFEKTINFALVSIQIAYPTVYRLLSQYSGFDKWDEKIAIQMNLKSLDSESIEKLNNSEEFDEDWEKVLFRLCENDHYLKKKALNISRLLNSLRKIIKEKGEDIEDTINSIISLSSVTNLEAFDKPVIDYHRGSLLKDLRGYLLESLRKSLPEIAEDIQPQGARVQSNAVIKFTKENWGDWIRLHSHPFEEKIRLLIITDRWLSPIKHDDLKSCLKEANILDEFEIIERDYNLFISKYPHFTALNLCDEISKRDRWFQTNMPVYLTLPSVDDFYKVDILKELNDVIVDLHGFIQKLKVVGKKVEDFYTLQ